MMTAKQAQDVSLPEAVNVLTRHQRRQLSVASLGIDERTIRRAYLDPASVRESTLLRIAEAARSLGLPHPVAAARLRGPGDGEVR
jgi:predicted metal-dependent phosphoesterase TrpH